jgi:hypothetical protein
VTTPANLETALRDGSFDVVLTNVSDASDLERAQATVERNTAVVLPAVYLIAPAGQRPTKNQSKAEREKASRDFAVIVEVPGRPGHYCHAVDQAMELKLKRDKAAAARRP